MIFKIVESFDKLDSNLVYSNQVANNVLVEDTHDMMETNDNDYELAPMIQDIYDNAMWGYGWIDSEKICQDLSIEYGIDADESKVITICNELFGDPFMIGSAHVYGNISHNLDTIMTEYNLNKDMLRTTFIENGWEEHDVEELLADLNENINFEVQLKEERVCEKKLSDRLRDRLKNS